MLTLFFIICFGLFVSFDPILKWTTIRLALMVGVNMNACQDNIMLSSITLTESVIGTAQVNYLTFFIKTHHIRKVYVGNFLFFGQCSNHV